ncbi:GntR family transcriptional regulator [Agrobacterium rosae]|uniref:GntR family transcriptional regulator n=1 Tax=Agrobacterium rosae TaxID=1972867 RepID=A0AAW9FPR3_9HYPH|nr:GntR family transcriptional regulator [Agrobacterium rosae]MDX8304479.1 GntR family transcriptional regulator [Agrobacterium rosae]
MKKRYEQVARELTARVAEGVYPLGSTLPSEPALAEELGVSRSTVRAALSELQQLGMVSRRPALGTRVDSVRPVGTSGGYAQTIETIDALVQYAAKTRRTILDIVDIVADDALAARLEVRAGSRWLCVSHLRRDPTDISKPPICYTEVYVDARYADSLRERVQDYPGAYSEIIEEVSGRRVVEIEQTLSACAVTTDTAERLQASAGQPALEITRRYYFSGNDLAEVTVSVHPADRFRYTSRLKRVESIKAP